jgi:hypothetical protein
MDSTQGKPASSRTLDGELGLASSGRSLEHKNHCGLNEIFLLLHRRLKLRRPRQPRSELSVTQYELRILVHSNSAQVPDSLGPDLARPASEVTPGLPMRRCLDTLMGLFYRSLICRGHPAEAVQTGEAQSGIPPTAWARAGRLPRATQRHGVPGGRPGRRGYQVSCTDGPRRMNKDPLHNLFDQPLNVHRPNFDLSFRTGIPRSGGRALGSY